VDALIEMKLEKHKNLWEESNFFWGEIDDGTLKFDRPRVEVSVF
jgi:insulysin